MFYNSLAEMQKSYRDRVKDILDKVVKANVSRRKYEKIMLAAAKELTNMR